MSVAISLLLLRALVAVLALAEAKLQHPAPEAFVAATLCGAGGADGDSPPCSDGDRHCLSCPVGERQRVLDSLAAAPGPGALPATSAAPALIRPASADAPPPIRALRAQRSRAPPTA